MREPSSDDRIDVAAVTTTTVHLIPYLVERGIDPAVAATATGSGGRRSSH